MNVRISPEWRELLQPEFDAPYFKSLTDFVRGEYHATQVFPPASLIFNAFDSCPPQEVKVLILGQDPYHNDGQAMGLSFSVPRGVALPPSLVNIYKEISDETGRPAPADGDLTRWARQGVLLLNATLTVRAHAPASHQGHGWETFTDNVISRISAGLNGVVFMLWGRYAICKAKLIDHNRHLVLTAPHPSPLSAYRGFFGCGHFAQANEYLRQTGRQPIEW
ncbi:MAG: uracil-DNA glycosylase [Bacteroidales bacterium]|nr:uracil-DNA glycosylase [Bacteroidales bacterium]